MTLERQPPAEEISRPLGRRRRLKFVGDMQPSRGAAVPVQVNETLTLHRYQQMITHGKAPKKEKGGGDEQERP